MIFRICFFFSLSLALLSIHYRSRAHAARAPSSSYPSKSTKKCVVSTCSLQVGIDRIVMTMTEVGKVPVGPTMPLHGMLEDMPAITHSKQNQLTNK